MSTLDRAIAIAADAHAGQEKAGEPYILHPLRVMLSLATTDERIAGVLHDVVEKNPTWPLAALRAEGFSEDVLAAIDAVSRREGEEYEEFILRAGQDDLGRRVKLADLSDNIRTSQSLRPTDKIVKKIAKHEKARALLTAWPPRMPVKND